MINATLIFFHILENAMRHGNRRNADDDIRMINATLIFFYVFENTMRHGNRRNADDDIRMTRLRQNDEMVMV
jgi:hypothetical protein